MGCDRPLTCILGGIGCSHAMGLSVIPNQNGVGALARAVTSAAGHEQRWGFALVRGRPSCGREWFANRLMAAPMGFDHDVTCAEAMAARDGRWLEAAGLVLVRQRPGSAKGVMFITIEDETGVANLVVWPSVFERQRRIVLSAGMMSVRGKIQREGAVVHLVAHHLTNLSEELASVGERDGGFPLRTDEVIRSVTAAVSRLTRGTCRRVRTRCGTSTSRIFTSTPSR
jgi:hypothetical protein